MSGPTNKSLTGLISYQGATPHTLEENGTQMR